MKHLRPGRRAFRKGSLLFACMIAGSAFAQDPADERKRGARESEPSDARASSRETIYTGVSLEFVQLWDHATRIRQTRELGLGNLVVLAGTFHLGHEAERRRWKDLYPGLSEQIDKVPPTETLKEVGAAAMLEVPEDVLIEQARLCRENELYFNLAAYMTKCKGAQCADLVAKLKDLGGKYFLSYSALGESTSRLGSGQSAAAWKDKEGLDPAGMNAQGMHDWFADKARRAVLEAKQASVPLTDNIEATTQFRLGLEAGADVPILELVPSEPLSGLAAVRGAAKAYGSPFWGVCFAFGYYRPPVDLSVPNRARIAYNLFYAGGARLFVDLNDYFHIYSLGAGWFADPRPPARMGEKEFRDFDDPICVAARNVLQDHYKFVRFHDRPPGGPRVKIAFALGHLDGYTGWAGQSHVWGVKEPGWEANDAEKTWRYFHRLYDVEPWYTPPVKGYWQNDPLQTLQRGTPPCGQVDIVPVEAPLGVLQGYRCLVFLGWNTMTDALYDKLERYVRSGGRLFMSLPQLSAQTTRTADLQLIRGGDYRGLFGARIAGAGEAASAVRFVRPGTHPAYRFPQGAAYQEGMRLAAVETSGAVALAETPEGAPVLLENRAGQGFAYLLTTWGYPGPHLPSFMTDVLRTISNGEQDDIAVEGDAIFYAIYGGEATDSLTTIYLVNRSYYGLPQYARVGVRGRPVLVQVGGYDMRIVWTRGDLAISPFDRFVKVEKIEAASDEYNATLVAEKGAHRIQVAALGRAIDAVALDGKPQALARDPEGATCFDGPLDGKHRLTVRLR